MQKRKNAKNGYNVLRYNTLQPFSFCNPLQIFAKKGEMGRNGVFLGREKGLLIYRTSFRNEVLLF